jgi:hypothetical protein
MKSKREKFRFEQFSAPSGTHQPDRNSNLPPTCLIRLAPNSTRISSPQNTKSGTNQFGHSLNTKIQNSEQNVSIQKIFRQK